MKKLSKYFIGASIIALIICSVMILTRKNTVFPRRVSSNPDALFYVKTKDKNGNAFYINLDCVLEDDTYINTLYLPGNTSKDCYLLWDNKEISVLCDNKEIKSGELIVPNEGDILSLEVDDGKAYIVKTFIASQDVESLFIDLDENEGTISDMNNDPKHDTSCYGHVFFDNKEYVISIKGRGNTTWRDGPKKPYNITFLEEEYSGKKKVAMIENVETSKWSLLANYGDPSLLRNGIGYSLANKLSVGLPTKYYDIWMNSEYLGNYLITPKNDYQASDDGFILEIDNTIDEEDPQFNIYNDNGVIDSLLFTVKNDDGEYGVDEIQRITQVTWDAIEYYDSELYQEYIDIESWAKVYLLNELYKNYDVVNGSIYMYRDSRDSGKMKAGPIWDLDNSLGISSFNLMHNQEVNTPLTKEGWYINTIKLDGNNYCWFQELAKHQSFVDEIKKVYEDNREFFLEVEQEIQNEYEANIDSSLSDFNKWGKQRTFNNFLIKENKVVGLDDNSIEYVATNEYEDYFTNFCSYTLNRLKYIDNNINEIK